MKTKLLMASMALATAFNAQAVQITFGSFTGEWENVVAQAEPFPPVPGPAGTTTEIFWGEGTPTQSQQSGYRFESSMLAPIEFDPMVGMSGNFELGTFTHLNNVITGASSSLISVDLRLKTQITVGMLAPEDIEFLFSFTHEETPNSANPCAYGPAGQTGVNENGCADRVTTTTNEFTDTFMIDGVDYTIDIRGFTVGGNFVDGFLTKEKVDNSAQIIAKITAFEDINEVPEPTPFAILGAGLLGLGAVRRMKKTKAENTK